MPIIAKQHGEASMIETTKQCVSALEEIKSLTKWTNGRLATKLGVPGSTVHRILKQDGDPTSKTMDMVDAELKRVRKVHG